MVQSFGTLTLITVTLALMERIGFLLSRLTGSGDDWGVRFCGNDHLLTGVLLAVFQGGYCLVGMAGVHMQGRQASASAINFRNSVEGGAAVGGQFGYIKNGASAGRGVCTEIEGNAQRSIVYINFP